MVAVCGAVMVLVGVVGAFTSTSSSVAQSNRSIAGAQQGSQLVRLAHTLSVRTYAPPTSISDTCSADVTDALNAWFATLPKGATVSLPSDACYLVSNSPSDLLTLQGKEWLTIDGNGTTFEQNTYADTSDGGAGPRQPILTIGGNFGLTINDVTLRGPGANGGSSAEGDAGILMWLNVVVRLNGVTITNVEGDGLDVYPLGNDPGVNWFVVVDHSTIENVGYKAIVPEAADHFSVKNSTLASNDIDAEVDFSCQPPGLPLADCGTFDNPTIGVVNMTLKDDSFPNGLALEDEMSCMPVGNWTIKDNNFGTGGLVAQFDAAYGLSLSALQTCGPQAGLTIEGNTSTDSQRPCCGAGSPYVLLQGWKDVTIADNHFVYDLNQGLVGGPVVELWGDSNVAITDNAFVNYYNVVLSDAPSGWPATTGLTMCGNITGTPQYPVAGNSCPG